MISPLFAALENACGTDIVPYWLRMRVALREEMNFLVMAFAESHNATMEEVQWGWAASPDTMGRLLPPFQTAVGKILEEMDILAATEAKRDFLWVNLMIMQGQGKDDAKELLLAYIKPRYQVLDILLEQLNTLCSNFIKRVIVGCARQN